MTQAIVAGQPVRPSAARPPVLEVGDLRAYYQTRYFGIEREVRAVDDISLQVAPNEIYGLAGESSCGKTTLIKTVASAIRPPLNVVGGRVHFNFRDGGAKWLALEFAKLEAA